MFKLSRQFCEMIEILDHDTVLCGPWRDVDKTEIDDIFGKNVVDCIPDILIDCGFNTHQDLVEKLQKSISSGNTLISHRGSQDEDIRIVACLDQEGYERGPVAVLLSEDGTATIIGSFVGVDIAVDLAFRRQGVGLLLACIRMMQDEALPTWELDEPAYSSDGAQCMQNMLDVMQEIVCSLRNGSKLPSLLSGVTISAPDLPPLEKTPCP